MRIDDIQQNSIAHRITISARMTWEDCDRPAARIQFDVPSDLADDVDCSPNSFIAAVAVPAMFYGERRVQIDGAICPVLHDNLTTVITQLREWYGTDRIVPSMEPTGGFEILRPRAPGRAAQFFSGGIDALATLRRNRLMYPLEHPSSVRDCLNVFGMHPDDYCGPDPNPARVELWDRNLARLRDITDAAGVQLFQIRTNVIGLFDDIRLLGHEYHSAVMLAMSHLLPRRVSEIFLASSDYLGHLEPWGSHPLIDTFYSSSAVRIHHDGTRLGRLEKVRLIAEWPAALSMLNVCSSWTVPEQGMNCGKCEKCLRTMTELLVCGKLDQATTFPANQVDPRLLAGFVLRGRNDAAYFVECIEPLRAMGQHDLAAAIEDRLVEYHAWQHRKAGLGWKQRLKKLDDKVFGGLIRRKWAALRERTIQPAVL